MKDKDCRQLAGCCYAVVLHCKLIMQAHVLSLMSNICCVQELTRLRTRLDSSQFASSDVILNMLMSYRDIQVSFVFVGDD